MAKVTIYLPDELEAEVRSAGISMSPVCQNALKEAVMEAMLSAQASTEVEAVAERLRASREVEKRDERTEGRQLGVRWAKEAATLSELLWAAEVATAFWYSVWVDVDDGTLVDFLSEEKGWEFRANDEGRVSFERSPFMVAFLEGATDVYQEVRPLL